MSGASSPSPRLYRWGTSIVLGCYWLIMFTGTHWPHVSLEHYPQNFDKVLHFTGYAGFGFLIAAWVSARRKFGLRDFAAGFAVIFVYAILDEVTQPYFGRDCEFGDMLADWIGGTCGMGIFWLAAAAIRKIWPSKVPPLRAMD
ncbi:MAG TPA: VanZ family protein [Pirellulales bacterium]|nr:VanZ family protein [Pirellulales bacterium]